MWTPRPVSALRYAASVATSVLPSPVRISAILPLWSAMPPISCTSKCRMLSVRLPASRTTANASGSRSSSASPLPARVLNSAVFARSSSSASAEIAGSSALILRTACAYCFSRRSLRLPKMRVRILEIIGLSCCRAAKKQGVRTASPLPLRSLPAGESRDGRRLRRREETDGVLRHAEQAHLEVQMGPRRAAGRPHRADALAAHHEVALLDVHRRRVRVPRHEAVAVIDLDHPTILGVEARVDHLAARGGEDRRAGLGREVDALVERALARERVDPCAEIR